MNETTTCPMIHYRSTNFTRHSKSFSNPLQFSPTFKSPLSLSLPTSKFPPSQVYHPLSLPLPHSPSKAPLSLECPTFQVFPLPQCNLGSPGLYSWKMQKRILLLAPEGNPGLAWGNRCLYSWKMLFWGRYAHTLPWASPVLAPGARGFYLINN